MSSNVENGIWAVRAFARACGIDPDKDPITSIDIHADCKSVAKVTVAFLHADDRERVTQVIKRYRLVEIEEVESSGSINFREFT